MATAVKALAMVNTVLTIVPVMLHSVGIHLLHLDKHRLLVCCSLQLLFVALQLLRVVFLCSSLVFVSLLLSFSRRNHPTRVLTNVMKQDNFFSQHYTICHCLYCFCLVLQATIVGGSIRITSMFEMI